MLYEEKIPGEIQEVLKCDSLVWNSNEGVFYPLVWDDRLKYFRLQWVVITREELFCLWAKLQDYYETLMDEYMVDYNK